MSHWKSLRIRLLNKILILAFLVIAFLWIIGKVEFHGLPNLSGQTEETKTQEKSKKAIKKNQ